MSETTPEETPVLDGQEELDLDPAPAGPICPECRDGKHTNCVGYALNPKTDLVVDCCCPHAEGGVVLA